MTRAARFQSALKRATLAAGVLLGVFHVKLLASHALSGELTDPSLVARWILAGALVGALVILRRQGQSVIWSRKAVAVWLLAILLHGPSLVSRFDTIGAPALPEVAATLAQASAASIAAIGLGLLLVLFVARWRPAPRRVSYIAPACLALSGALDPGAYSHLAPRPPPRR